MSKYLRSLFFKVAFAATVSMLALAAKAADTVVIQKDKAFSPVTLKVKVGDSVEFRNEDTIFHNVFSLSDVKSFDLGSYPKGQSRKVTFDKPGVVEVECAIHPQMHLKIEVAP